MVAVLLCTTPIAAQEPDTMHDTRLDTALVAEDKQTVELGDYWLGLWCMPVPPSLRLQEKLPEKQGLLVMGVASNSPASDVGFMQKDILLRVGDKPLTDPGDLIQAINTAKGGKLKIELLREGKTKTLEATPAKRPEDAGRTAAAAPSDRDWETMEKWFHENWPGGEADGRQPNMRYRFFHPGAIIPGNVPVLAPLPPNMSVVISKEGDHPVEITVKRGDEKWEVTEKELDKLPADVRPHVERMLGRGPFGVVGSFPSPDFAPGMPPPKLDSAAWQSRMEKRLDEMNQRMDRILRTLEGPMGGHDQPRSPEKSTPK
jgi:membrane-associated protease RseP (regulator of RpoE activity)